MNIPYIMSESHKNRWAEIERLEELRKVLPQAAFEKEDLRLIQQIVKVLQEDTTDLLKGEGSSRRHNRFVEGGVMSSLFEQTIERVNWVKEGF